LARVSRSWRNGYYFHQVSGDSGSGATLGAFKAETVGVGPVLSFVSKVDGHDLVAELKWLHETDTENRMKGNFGWLKLVFKLY
jgi:hypothetical protein